MSGDAQDLLSRLQSREVPDWYHDAKFGIFIHWGPFAIPAFAPHTGSIGEIFSKDYDRAVALAPYSEWYWNAIKVPGTPSAEFHREHYGDAPYQNFKAPFEESLEQWDPAAWAETFRDAGARYVVLVTKHHDGFCLWPSAVGNKHERNWTTRRDLVGELAEAVRGVGLRFGVYYSGGIDWTFNRRPIRTLADFFGSTPGGDYRAYAMDQTRELIERYEPSVLWNDIAWPTGQGELNQLFADYYEAVPDGVVNDRWGAASWKRDLLHFGVVRRYVDRKIQDKIRGMDPADSKGVIPEPVPHSDFRTPEYAAFTETQTKKWEATRGMSHSFGYNRLDTDADYSSGATLIHDFIDAVARNGNMLLNIGPRGIDATIPDVQIDRLKCFGAWLRAHGAAIYGTRPWTQSDAESDQGQAIRFTTSPDRVNLIIKGPVAEQSVTIKNLTLDGTAQRLDDNSPVTLTQIGPDLQLRFTTPCTDPIATAVAIHTSTAAVQSTL